ncbi:MAG: hypothetical protein M3P29_03950, partial [Acidobacteriota bacterium]|nr:hypothetical protein [Acidobacteriota bacterium]
MLIAIAALIPGLASAQINSIEINQAIGVQKNNARKFVAGKSTVVRALMASAGTVDKSMTNAKVSRGGTLIATLAPNDYSAPTAFVDFQCTNLDACGRWAAGSYTFDVTVNGVSKSTAGTTYDFVERKAVRILAVPVKANYGG